MDSCRVREPAGREIRGSSARQAWGSTAAQEGRRIKARLIQLVAVDPDQLNGCPALATAPSLMPSELVADQHVVAGEAVPIAANGAIAD